MKTLAFVVCGIAFLLNAVSCLANGSTEADLYSYQMALDREDYKSAALIGGRINQRIRDKLLWQDYLALQLELAAVNVQAGNVFDAKNIYQDLLNRIANEGRSGPEQIDILLALSALQTKVGDSDKATKNLDQLFLVAPEIYGVSNPVLIDPYTRASDLYMELGFKRKADEALAKADRIRSDFSRVSSERGLLRAEQRDKDCLNADVSFLPVDVFFATTREDEGEDQPPAKRFGGRPDENWSYGISEVSVPCNRIVGDVTRPDILDYVTLNLEPDAERHFIIKSIQATRDEDVFFRTLTGAVSETSKREAFVFIHGYNTSFDGAVYRTAQMAADLDVKNPVVPILFSWPSRGNLLGYFTDRESLSYDLKVKLGEFLYKVSQDTGAKKIHLIAHSLGNRYILEALNELKNQRPDASKIFNEIVLAAADVPVGDFTSYVNRISDMADRITLYSSKYDRALLASQLIQGHDRAGGMDPPLSLTVLDTVDTSQFSGGLLGHDDFAGAALDDLRAIVWLSLMPNQRCVLSPVEQSGRSFWSIRNEACGEVEFSRAIKSLRRNGCETAIVEAENAVQVALLDEDPARLAEERAVQSIIAACQG